MTRVTPSYLLLVFHYLGCNVALVLACGSYKTLITLYDFVQLLEHKRGQTSSLSTYRRDQTSSLSTLEESDLILEHIQEGSDLILEHRREGVHLGTHPT